MSRIRRVIWDDYAGTWGDAKADYPLHWPTTGIYEGETHNPSLEKLRDFPSLTPWNIRDKNYWKRLPDFSVSMIECPSQSMQAIMQEMLDYMKRWEDCIKYPETEKNGKFMEDFANYYDDHREDIERYVSSYLTAQVNFFGIDILYWGIDKAFVYNPSSPFFKDSLGYRKNRYMPGKWILMTVGSLLMSLASEMEKTSYHKQDGKYCIDYWRSTHKVDDDPKYGTPGLPFPSIKTHPDSKLNVPLVWNIRKVDVIKTLLEKDPHTFEILILYMRQVASTVSSGGFGYWYAGPNAIYMGDGSLVKVTQLRKILTYEYDNHGSKIPLINVRSFDPSFDFFQPWLRPLTSIYWVMYILNVLRADYLEMVAQDIIDKRPKEKEILPWSPIRPKEKETLAWSDIKPTKTARDKVEEDKEDKKEYDKEKDKASEFELPTPLPLPKVEEIKEKLMPYFGHMRELWKDTGRWQFMGLGAQVWPYPRNAFYGIMRIDPYDKYDEDYLKVIEFMINNPLPKLRVPPYNAEEWTRHTKAWHIAADRQFEVYLIWCIKNTMSQKGKNYKEPGSEWTPEQLEKIGVKSATVIMNAYPDYGILDHSTPFEASVKKVIRFIAWGTDFMDWIFGDTFWDKFFSFAQATFNMLLEVLEKVIEIVGENLYWILPLAAVIVGGYIGTIVLKEKIKRIA